MTTTQPPVTPAPLVVPSFVEFQRRSAKEPSKEALARDFIRFVESGFQEHLFTERLYTFTQHAFALIAHYDRNGFYAAEFGTIERRVKFVLHALRHPCYGLPQDTYSDVASFLIDWMTRTGLIHRLFQQFRDEQTATELTILKQLLAKYPDHARQFLQQS